MYNRYIPQPDGSYRRSRIPEQNTPHSPPKKRESIQELPAPAAPEMPCPPEPKFSTGQQTSVLDFFRHLMPKDFDTGDLLIVLLLLLMAGDCAEDQNTALLTLVLYLFL